RNLSQAVVLGIRNVEVTGSNYRHTVRAGQFRINRGTAVTPISRAAGPRDSGDHARGRYLANACTEALRHVQIAGAIHRDAQWHVKLRTGSRSSISQGTWHA